MPIVRAVMNNFFVLVYFIKFSRKQQKAIKAGVKGSIFPENFQFENKKVRTTDINPILDKIAQFNRVNRKNKKRDKSKKEDLSRSVPWVGIEPTLPKKLDFESSASTSSATKANCECKCRNLFAL